MSEFSRRALMGGAAAAAASAIWSQPVHAQLVWQKADWHSAEFDALARLPRRIKHIVHAFNIDGGRFLNNSSNSLNGVHFGYGVPLDQIQIVCALNGPANILNYNNYIWEKYRVGEWAKVDDPNTGKPALRNIFYPAKMSPASHPSSENPSDEDSIYQDTSIEAQQARGVRFVSCHNSTEAAARAFIKQNNLTAQREEVVRDMLSHTLPGVIVVPAVASALAMLQCEGHYGYMSA